MANDDDRKRAKTPGRAVDGKPSPEGNDTAPPEARTTKRRAGGTRAKKKKTAAKRPATKARRPRARKPQSDPHGTTATPASAPKRSTPGPRGIDYESEELGIGSRVVPPLSRNDDAAPAARAPSPPPLPRRGEEARDVEAQIRALEARLDGMIRRTGDAEEAPEPSLGEQVGTVAREVVERIASPLPIERPAGDSGVVDVARELVSGDYYLRQWGRIGMRNRSEEVDDFGLDPTYEQRIRPLLEFLYKSYFRAEVAGVDRVPSDGRCVIVANHSGTLPLDGPMLRTALRLEHPAARELRWLAEDFIYYLPFVGSFMNRIGAVRACQENAERLLMKHAGLVGVFPEGVKGIGKLYRDRYKLQRFGRGGFIRLCLRTQTPLLPCAIVGAEEASPMLLRIELPAKSRGLPYLPLTPTFPWLGAAGLFPAPTKWRIFFGEPVRFDEYGPEAANDHVLVGRLAESVRSTIQRMLDRGVRERRSVWFG